MKRSASFLLLSCLWACASLFARGLHHNRISLAPPSSTKGTASIAPQQYRFNFKGYSTQINDDAVDENGNHLLVGEMCAEEKLPENRDTTINNILGLKDWSNDDPKGILIVTDKDYHIVKMDRAYIGKEVVYDAAKKQFTIGAMYFDYLHVGNESFSAWQPVIMQTKIELEWQSYWIVRPYSCILQHIAMDGNEILVFTRSEKKRDREKHGQIAEVMRVSPAQYHRDSSKLWLKALDILASTETPYDDIGSLYFSAISKLEESYYFETNNLDQWTLSFRHHLYRYSDGKLEEMPLFPDYLRFLHHQSDLVCLNEFIVRTPTAFSILSHPGGSKTKMTYTETDANFRTTLTKEIPLHDDGDYHKMLILSNANIVLVMVNATQTWSYQLYSPKMDLLQEVDSKISSEYMPILLQETADHALECIFHVHNVKLKDCVVEVLRWR